MCDVCESLHGSMDELIPHVHSHGFIRIEPVFLFGAIYGMTEEKAEGLRNAAALARF